MELFLICLMVLERWYIALKNGDTFQYRSEFNLLPSITRSKVFMQPKN